MGYVWIYIAGFVLMMLFLIAFDPCGQKDEKGIRATAGIIAAVVWPIALIILIGFFINHTIYAKKESE